MTDLWKEYHDAQHAYREVRKSVKVFCPHTSEEEVRYQAAKAAFLAAGQAVDAEVSAIFHPLKEVD